MPTRETHARIYQGELNLQEVAEIENLSKRKKTSIPDLILDAIKNYLKDLEPEYHLKVDHIVLNDGSLRFYLWIPYDACEEIDRYMKKRGEYVQELTRKSIRAYYKMKS